MISYLFIVDASLIDSVTRCIGVGSLDLDALRQNKMPPEAAGVS